MAGPFGAWQMIGAQLNLELQSASPEPLPRILLQEMEHFFQFTLTGVRLHLFRQEMTPFFPRQAFTIDNHIFFRRDCFAPDSLAGRVLLVHELAHCVQTRLGALGNRRVSTPLYQLEAEASLASVCQVAGEKAPALSPNTRNQALAWDEVGHFYTVLFVVYYATHKPELAADLAFFAQMPDQVVELDACVAGEELVKARYQYRSFPPGVQLPVLIFELHKLRIPGDRGGANPTTIQRGLHCLTGGNSLQETKYRLNTLEKLGSHAKCWELGLALHALGDSFAHRQIGNEKELYQTGFGHAWDFEKPDNICWNRNRQRLYCEYGTVMYRLLKKLFGTTGDRGEQYLWECLMKIAGMRKERKALGKTLAEIEVDVPVSKDIQIKTLYELTDAPLVLAPYDSLFLNSARVARGIPRIKSDFLMRI